MPIKIEFDSNHNPLTPTLVLVTKGGKKLGVVPAYDIKCRDSIDSPSEISFRTYKKDNALWNQIKDLKLIWAKEWNAVYEIKVEIEDGDSGIFKTVACKSLGESELSQIKLHNVEIRTEKDISRDDYVDTVFYNSSETNASALHRVMQKAPHYTITHVDEDIAEMRRTFSFNNTDIASALKQFEEELDCKIIFDCSFDEDGELVRGISVRALEGDSYGVDTGIFISSGNLADSITCSTDEEGLINCYKLEGGDGLFDSTIINSNPTGEYLWNFTESSKEDMSEGLAGLVNNFMSSIEATKTASYYSTITQLPTGYNNILDVYLNAGDANLSIDTEQLPERITSISDYKGYAGINRILYNVIDFLEFLKNGLSPISNGNSNNASGEMGKITPKLNNFTVYVSKAEKKTLLNVTSQIENYLKSQVDVFYNVKIENASLNGDNWSGTVKITSKVNTENTASGNFTRPVSINPVAALVVETRSLAMRVFNTALKEKLTNNYDIEYISALTEGMDNADDEDVAAKFAKFCSKSLLESMCNTYTTATNTINDIISQQYGQDIDSFISVGYTEGTAEAEIKKIASNIRRTLYCLEGAIGIMDGRISVLTAIQTRIEAVKANVVNSLKIETFFGSDYAEFASFRRDGVYSNENYISDGLSNRELFERVSEFFDAAQKEVDKNAEKHYKIESTLKNLLLIREFEPVVDNFCIGNWLRIKVDETIYKLRLSGYEIDFSNLSRLDVEFSDIKIANRGANSVKSLVDKTDFLSFSYNNIYDKLRQYISSIQDAYNNLLKSTSEDINSISNKLISNTSDYSSSLDDLLNGIRVDGIPGVSYLHVKYSNVENPTAAQMKDTPDEYIGTYVDENPADSTDPTKYTWYRLKGEAGVPGSNGTYLHIAYADNIEEIEHNTTDNTVEVVLSDGSVKKILYVGSGTNIQDNKYKNNTVITKVVIPSNNISTKINSRAFNGCTNLAEVVIEKEVSEISNSAFENCTNLKRIILPSSITRFGSNVFDGCNNLTNINFRGTEQQWNSISWNSNDDKPTNATITYEYSEINSDVIATGFSLDNYTDKVYLGQYADTNRIDSIDPSDYKWLKIKGDDGTSIENVVNYYIASNLAEGVTDNPSFGWDDAIPNLDAENKYLWNYEIIFGTNGTEISRTAPCIIGVFGEGQDGVGISSIVEHYQVSSSNINPPSTWVDIPGTNPNAKVPSMTSTNKYLWNYETITYTNNSKHNTAKRVIGVYGDKGDTGKSIESVVNYYLASALSSGIKISSTQPDPIDSSNGWSDTVPTLNATKKYLWNYEVIKDTNGNTMNTPTPRVIGVFGKGIESIAEWYIATNTNSAPEAPSNPTDSGWKSSPTATGFSVTNRYLWNYEIITYTTSSDGSSNTSTTNIKLIGVWGESGEEAAKTEVQKFSDTINNAMGLNKYVDSNDRVYYHSHDNISDSTFIYTVNAGGFAFTDDWKEGNPTWHNGVSSSGAAFFNTLQALYAKIGGWDISNKGIEYSVPDRYEIALNTILENNVLIRSADSLYRTRHNMNSNVSLSNEQRTSSEWKFYYLMQIVENPVLEIQNRNDGEIYGVYPNGAAKFKNVICEDGINGMRFASGRALITPTQTLNGRAVATVDVDISGYNFESFTDKTDDNAVRVFTSPETDSPDIVSCSVKEITNTSFTLYLVRTNNSYIQTGVNWFAVQQSKTSIESLYPIDSVYWIENLTLSEANEQGEMEYHRRDVTLEENKYVVFKFTPKSDGTYVFTSSDRTSSNASYPIYPKAWLYSDKDLTRELKYNSGGGASNNFRLPYALSVNTTYYLKVGCRDNRAGSYKVQVVMQDGSSGGTHTTHNYNFQSTTATCTEPGIDTYICTCGATKTENAPARGHDFSEHMGTELPYDIYKCSRCDAIDYRTAELTGLASLTFYVADEIHPDSFTVSWHGVEGANRYQVIVHKTDGSLVDEQEVSETTCRVTGLEESTTYEYKIKAKCVDGNTVIAESEYVYGVVTTTVGSVSPPSTPTGVDATASGTPSNPEITVSWNAVSGADGYEVSIYDSNYNKLGDHDVYYTDYDVSDTLYSSIGRGMDGDTILQPSTTYYVRVRSYVGSGSNRAYSDPSSYASAVTLSSEIPTSLSALTGLTVNDTSSNSFTISWNPVLDATGYTFTVCKTDDNGNAIPPAVSLGSTDGTSCQVTGLTAETEYIYGVAAYYQNEENPEYVIYSHISYIHVTTPGNSGSTYEALTLGSYYGQNPKTVNIENSSDFAVFSFTPQTSGTYGFCGFNYTLPCNPIARLFQDSNLSQAVNGANVSDDEISGSLLSFCIEAFLTGGETYYLKAYCENNTTGTYKVGVVQTHTHSYIYQSTTATCTSAGRDTSRCECGDIYYEDVPARGHDFSVYQGTVQPTATEQGYDIYKCSRCNATEHRNITEPTGSGSTIETLYLNTAKTVTVTSGENGAVKLRFTPTTSGTYIFASSNNGSYDPKAWLYLDENFAQQARNEDNTLVENDDYASPDRNFRISYYLEAGNTYYLKAGCFSNNAGVYDVTVTKEGGGSGGGSGGTEVQHDATDKIIDGVLYVGTNTILNSDKYKNRTDFTKVIIPSNNISADISATVFENCTNLTEVVIKNNVSKIYFGAFKNCTNLERIALPSSISYFANDVFIGCNNLTDIYYEGTEQQWNGIPWYQSSDKPTNVTVHYNSSL